MAATVETRAPSGRPPAESVERLSERLKALADPTRLRILHRLLASAVPVCVCDIGASFDLGQPTISHHLKTLREAGFLRAGRCGTWVYYWPERGALQEVRSALDVLAGEHGPSARGSARLRTVPSGTTG